jgi:hypothetical protein
MFVSGDLSKQTSRAVWRRFGAGRLFCLRWFVLVWAKARSSRHPRLQTVRQRQRVKVTAIAAA